jgi:RNA polymerase sigma-70 factor (ECF subfamily)
MEPDIPNLFRTEYRKITAVLCRYFGLENIGLAEDIASDTFLQASETWGLKGYPPNPVAWLYTVAKNKARDILKRDHIFKEKVSFQIRQSAPLSDQNGPVPDIDLSPQNISDSQLQMMFVICDPRIPAHSQIGLCLRILCGFGIDEIAAAFLTNKETINKRLHRAREKLRTGNFQISMPSRAEISERIDTVLTTLYLLFNEGYYSATNNSSPQKELCLEAMRLVLLLVENEETNLPSANALLSLMCFHASRFEARRNTDGDWVLYEDQDRELWNGELITRGEYFLNRASQGDRPGKYHIEAAIAYWHTVPEKVKEKWNCILQLYNRLLQNHYSPAAALNRTYALAKADGKKVAIPEAEKLGLEGNHLYHALLGNLYDGEDNLKSLEQYTIALNLCRTEADRKVLRKHISQLALPDQ